MTRRHLRRPLDNLNGLLFDDGLSNIFSVGILVVLDLISRRGHQCSMLVEIRVISLLRMGRAKAVRLPEGTTCEVHVVFVAT